MNDKRDFQTGNIITVSLAHFVHDIFSSFLSPLLPLLIEKFGISYSLAGLFTVFLRLPSLLNIFIGLVADKLPLRYFIITAPSITVIAMSLLGVAPSYTAAAILLVIAGFGAALFHTPAPVLIKQIAGSRIGKSMSFFMFGGELARTLGPLLILSAVSMWGLDKTYRLIPIGVCTSLILYFKIRKIKVNGSIQRQKVQSKVFETLRLNSGIFIRIIGITFFTGLFKASFTAFLPTFLTARGESLWLSGAALSILELAGAAGTFSAGTISDKIGRKNTLLIVVIVLPALMWLFISLGSFFYIFTLIAIGFFLFASMPVILAEVNNIPSDRPAFINGVYMTINFAVTALTVALIGLSGDIAGLELTYKITAFLPLLAIPFILTGFNETK